MAGITLVMAPFLIKLFIHYQILLHEARFIAHLGLILMLYPYFWAYWALCSAYSWVLPQIIGKS